MLARRDRGYFERDAQLVPEIASLPFRRKPSSVQDEPFTLFDRL